ncbi:acyltransferase family protein [Pseudoroseicyclus sp. CXY001]|uniref:acyltransferase family protein n=1 Tax=Pseudoroseicyclus sp. CXY001 TaxID=3242492 RepID=UPI00358DC9A2
MTRAAPLRIADLSSGRQNNFNLIRILAAIGVLVSHAWPLSSGPGTREPLQAWLHGLTLGRVCVYVFFAISGFFIAKSFERSRTRRRFVRARVMRLYPALIVMLLLTVLVAGLFLTEAPAAVFWAAVPEFLLRNLTLAYIQFEMPGVFLNLPYEQAINGSLWSLFHEVMCYLCVVVTGAAGLLRNRRLFALAFALTLALCVSGPFLPLPGIAGLFLEVALPFVFGTAAYVWRASIPLSPLLLAALALAAALAWATPLFHAVFVLALSYGVLLLGFSRIAPLLAYNRLGDYSYGTYIYAFPVQQLAAGWGGDTPAGNIAFALPLTLACAVLSWHLIEKPALASVHRADIEAQRNVVI